MPPTPRPVLQSDGINRGGLPEPGGVSRAADICKGAPGNTSGRSVFPKCPVARHFVCLCGCIWYAISNCLEGGGKRLAQRVGFARREKDLLVSPGWSRLTGKFFNFLTNHVHLSSEQMTGHTQPNFYCSLWMGTGS